MNTEKKSCNEDVRNEISDFTQDEVQAAIDNLKKSKATDNNGIGPKTSRHATKRRKKRSDRSLRSVEARGLHTRNMEQTTNKSDLQKGNVE